MRIISSWILVALAFLIPLVFFRGTLDPLEINKQAVFLFGITLATILWLADGLKKKEISLRKNPAVISAAFFTIAVAVSAALSLTPAVSWIGQGSQEYMSFLTIAGSLCFLVIGADLLQDKKVAQRVWGAAFFSSTIIALLAIVQVLGIAVTINLIGTPNALAIYLAFSAVLGSGLLLFDGKGDGALLPKGVFRIASITCIWITSIGTLAVLLVLDVWFLWATLILGVVFLFIFAFLHGDDVPRVSSFLPAMTLVTVAIVFLLLPPFLPSRFSAEISPTYANSFHIAQKTLKDTNVITGSGGGTFALDYAKHRMDEVNNSSLWDARFDRSSSHFITMLTTFGVLGLAAFLIFVGTMIWQASVAISADRAGRARREGAALCAAWLVLLFAMAVYSSNFTLTFLFWLASAGILALGKPNILKIDFVKSSRGVLFGTFGVILLHIGLLTMLFLVASRYSGELAFKKSVELNRASASIDEVIAGLDKAAQRNKLSDVYYRNLSYALLLRAGEELARPARDDAALQQYLSLSIRAAQRATELGAADPLNWEILGDVYRELTPLEGSADLLAIQSYGRASELAPGNPKYKVSIGRAYLLRIEKIDALAGTEDAEVAQTLKTERQKAIDSATLALGEAVALKSNYTPAHYYLALAYEKAGNLSEAITRLESVRASAPNDVGVSLQLGLLYLRQGRNNDAKAELERAVSIAPQFSNARWFLASVYEELGDKEAAIGQLEAVLSLNPDNDQVKERLEKLRAGGAPQESTEPLNEEERTPGDELEQTP